MALEGFDKAPGELRQRQLGTYTQVSYLIICMSVTILQGNTWKHHSGETVAVALATFSTREHENFYGKILRKYYYVAIGAFLSTSPNRSIVDGLIG